jgi:hypothetical protein
MLVARAPEIPGIATHDLFRREINAAIHRFENVGSDLRKICSGFSSRFRFVNWLVLSATREREEQAGADPDETEKIALGLEESLHRTVIYMSVANRVAR